MITKILISISVILLLILIFLLINNKMLKTTIIKIQKQPLVQTSFDPLIGNGMDVINDYIKVNFLKFLNTKLITINEDSDTPISNFLSELSSDDKMKNFASGFVVYIDALMSFELKSFFNKYYKVLNPNGETTFVFVEYITEWVILFIRELQAELSARKLDNEDYSIATNTRQNSEIFISLEMDLYKRMKITEIVEEKQK